MEAYNTINLQSLIVKKEGKRLPHGRRSTFGGIDRFTSPDSTPCTQVFHITLSKKEKRATSALEDLHSD
ncbi:hypothetical protein BSG1_05664 [Bacillus sp. SG-1]|nr:hypothetical protein BSG1_05664 [Bacillus sp. SG-1]